MHNIVDTYIAICFEEADNIGKKRKGREEHNGKIHVQYTNIMMYAQMETKSKKRRKRGRKIKKKEKESKEECRICTYI